MQIPTKTGSLSTSSTSSESNRPAPVAPTSTRLSVSAKTDSATSPGLMERFRAGWDSFWNASASKIEVGDPRYLPAVQSLLIKHAEMPTVLAEIVVELIKADPHPYLTSIGVTDPGDIEKVLSTNRLSIRQFLAGQSKQGAQGATEQQRLYQHLETYLSADSPVLALFEQGFLDISQFVKDIARYPMHIKPAVGCLEMLNNRHFRALIENGKIASDEFWDIYDYYQFIEFCDLGTRADSRGQNVYARIACSTDAAEVADLAEKLKSEAVVISKDRADRFCDDFGS